LINSHLVGDYNFNNIAAAICIGQYFNIPQSKIKAAIEGYIPSNNRSQIIQKGVRTLILDAYNANPSSITAALKNFSQLPEEKAVILGDMLELGSYAQEEHQRIVDLLQELGISQAYLIGKNFANTQHPYQCFESFEAFKTAFNPANNTANAY